MVPTKSKTKSQMAIDEREMILTLSELYNSQLDYIVDAAEIPPGVIPRIAPPKERAKALVEYFLESYGSLRGLYSFAYQVTSLNVMRD